MKKINDWVLSWADSPYSQIALFVVACLEAFLFPIPVDFLLLALVLGSASRAFRFTLICTAGSVSGAVIGYFFGSFLWIDAHGEFTGIARFFFDNMPGFSIDKFQDLQIIFTDHDFLLMLFVGFTPLPYQLFTISAGIFDLNIYAFLLASALSRGIRFLFFAWLAWKFGKPIKVLVQKNTGMVAFGIAVSLVLIFILVRVVT